MSVHLGCDELGIASKVSGRLNASSVKRHKGTDRNGCNQTLRVKGEDGGGTTKKWFHNPSSIVNARLVQVSISG